MFRVNIRYMDLAQILAQYLRTGDEVLAGITSPVEKVAAINEMQRLLGCTDAELGDRKRLLKENESSDPLRCATGQGDVPDGGKGRGPGDSSTPEPEPDGSAQQSPLRSRSRRRKNL
jgi:hypothetical protein